MSLTVLEAVCEPAYQINDDVWGQAAGAAWVLDGATGLSPKPLIGEDTDARWFVRRIDAALRAAIKRFEPTPAALAKSVAAVADEARQRCKIGETPAHELPSASMVMARDWGETLELVNLGDCVIVWRAQDLTKDLTVWQTLSERFEADVFCGMFMQEANEGLTVSAKTLVDLGSRGLKLDFDIYSREAS